MKEDFPLDTQCCICDKYKIVVCFDEYLNGAICKECYPHTLAADEAIIQDLIQCGILK